MSRLRRAVFLAPRLAALLATSYLLVATSYVPPDDCSGGAGCGGHGGSGGLTDVCHHLDESVPFHVTGTCGPAGDIVVTSTADECIIVVQGAGAVGIPPAGRFEAREHQVVDLILDVWTLSGYPPEAAMSGVVPSQPDAGTFTVAGSHATPTLRRCTNRPEDTITSVLSCSGGGIADCEAMLTRY